MDKCIIVDGKKIDTTNKTIIDVLVEAFKDVPITVLDIVKLENMLKEELQP